MWIKDKWCLFWPNVQSLRVIVLFLNKYSARKIYDGWVCFLVVSLLTCLNFFLLGGRISCFLQVKRIRFWRLLILDLQGRIDSSPTYPLQIYLVFIFFLWNGTMSYFMYCSAHIHIQKSKRKIIVNVCYQSHLRSTPLVIKIKIVALNNVGHSLKCIMSTSDDCTMILSSEPYVLQFLL